MITTRPSHALSAARITNGATAVAVSALALVAALNDRWRLVGAAFVVTVLCGLLAASLEPRGGMSRLAKLGVVALSVLAVVVGVVVALAALAVR